MGMIGNYRRVTSDELDALTAHPEGIADFLYPRDDSAAQIRRLDVDKAWHAIHFLLNQKQWEGEGPLFDVVLGGTLLGNVDVGYGPARSLTAREVKDVSEALECIPVSVLLDRFDANRLNDEGIYPDSWRDMPEERDYIGLNYVRLVKFFQQAAQCDDAVILYLN